MSAIDYVFDDTASLPANRVEDEEHLVGSSIAIIPPHGAFYEKDLVVKGIVTVNNQEVVEDLVADRDFLFSPPYMRVSAAAGFYAHSYILLRKDYEKIRISYQVVGGEYGADEELLTKVAGMTFDRSDVSQWLLIRGSEHYHPASRNPILDKAAELQIFNDSLGQINETLLKLTPGSDQRATNQQVTNLEIRQTELETIQSAISIEFNGIKVEFHDIKELFAYLEALVLNGCHQNVTMDDIFIYCSEVDNTTHSIPHNLNTQDLEVTVWMKGEDGVYHFTEIVTLYQDDLNTLILETDVSVGVMVIVRYVKPDNGGFTFVSQSAATSHTVQHDLGSGFVSSAVWVMNSGGKLEWRPLTEMNMISENRIDVVFDEPQSVRAIIQRPVENAFLYKAQSAQNQHIVEHDLHTPYVNVTVWVQGDDDVYHKAVVENRLVSATFLHTDLDIARKIKVLVQPAMVRPPTFEQDYEQRHAILDDRQDDLQLHMDALEAQMLALSQTVGQAIGVYPFETTDAALVHDIQHDLDDLTVSASVWVEHGDGSFHNDSFEAEVIDANNVRITLTDPANIRGKITSI